MPNSQLQNIDPNGNTNLNHPQQQPRRPSSGLYGMLRKTKNKTYSALRGSTIRTPDRQGSMNKLDEAAAEDETPDAKKRRTPKIMGSSSDGMTQPSTSFFSPQNSWVGSQRKSRGGIVMDDSVASLQVGDAQKNVEDVVAGVESSLRKLVICCAIFIGGTMMPERAGAMQKLLELSMVAWGTCLAIIGLVWFQKMQQSNYYSVTEGQEEQRQIGAFEVGVVGPDGPPDIQRRSAILDAKKAAKAAIDRSESDRELPTALSRKRSRHEIETTKPKILTPTKVTREKPTAFMPKHLEQLEDLYIMLVGKQERLCPNGVAVKIETDLFYGSMLLMFRTSDVDEPPPIDGNEDPVCAYFRGKQRRFEFQWQLRLKKVPTGEVYVGLDLDEPPAMGMIQRALVNTALKFIKKMNVGFGYHFSDSSDSPSYLAFPVGTSMDRFVATKPGEEAPKLGKDIVEDPEAARKRKRGAQIEWNTEDTYTMALWSAYFDWVDWQILNFPGIRPFSATSVAGVQPIKMNMYMIPNEEAKERDVLFAIEVSNSAKAALGNEAKAWKANYVSVASSAARVLEYSEEGSVNEHADDDIDDENSEEEEEDAEDAEIEELGMGRTLSHLDPSVYVTSGSCLSLREGTGSFVASGGGYAVLQSSSTSAIVLEKVFRSKKAQKSGMVSDPQMVIRNGDIVRVKLVNLSSNSSKYLRIHRGWWLRWTSNRPTKTSSFYIRTNESDATALLIGTPFLLKSRKWSSYQVGVCHESSAKYGGRMLAMYKAGKSAVEEEPPIDCDEDDDPIEDEDCKDFVAEKPINKPIMPLLLCAESVEATDAESASPPKRSPTHETQSKGQSRLDSFSSDAALMQYELDCPVWLEVMNRATRATQLVYAIRVKEIMSNEAAPKVYEIKRQSSEISQSDGQTDSGTEFQGRISLKLRSGREIAPLLSEGARYKDTNLAWEITNLQVDDDGGESGLGDFSNPGGLQRANSFSSSSSDDSDDEVIEDEQLDFLIAGPDNTEMNEFLQTGHDSYATIFPEDTSETTNADNEIARRVSCPEDDMRALIGTDKTPGKAMSEKDRLYNYDDGTRSLDTSAAASEHRVPIPKSPTSHDRSGQNDYHGDNTVEVVDLAISGHIESKKKSKTKVLNRVAKTVKSSTVITGKQVLKHSKKVGKATVSTGRAAGRVIPNSYKPPKKHEPGSVFMSAKKPPKKNSMKLIGRAIKNLEGKYSSELHSGQLSALDQSKEKISQILSQLSTNRSSAVCEAISSFVRTNSELDLSFLRGSSAELGVIPLKAIDAQTDHDCICARGIWDGRWREELCVMYRQHSHLAFYAPLARKPSLVVGFEEISSVRKCDSNLDANPLPGLSLVALDTAWRCTYLAFLTDSDRETFIGKINDAMYHANTNDVSMQTRKVAPEWESFKMSLETSLTGSGGKWASVSVGKKSKQRRQRRIFNGRRMTFDLEPVVDHSCNNGGNDGKTSLSTIALFAENLLHKALALSPNALDNTTQTSFTEFLDEVSRLRSVPLHEIDYESTEALCIFVNLYHCLLQHALLFAVDGLPDKRSVTRFKRCSCYEIGGDVFSLAELECCVIRGKLSIAVHLKPPLVDAAKKSRVFLQYALDAADNRVNFFMNNGSLDFPQAVPVFKCETLESQIQAAASSFLRNQVKINERKRVVFLPKVCDIYRNDFGMGDCLVCLSQILRYLDESSQLTIAALLENGGQITVKFQQPSEKFHTNLCEQLD